MRIALFGYGKMGQIIDTLATERGHEISLKITVDNLEDRKSVAENSDVIIEFSTPETALENIMLGLENNIPVVVGTTGWLDSMSEVEKKVEETNGCLIWASNFSIGVNIFFEINERLANLMNPHNQYDVVVDETHHVHKLDAPSGTAITIGEGILSNIDRKSSWSLDKADSSSELQINAHREDEVPGTHVVEYNSEIDSIKIRHEAKNRKGFALGAIVAAEWSQGKQGVFTMKDVLKN